MASEIRCARGSPTQSWLPDSSHCRGLFGIPASLDARGIPVVAIRRSCCRSPTPSSCSSLIVFLLLRRGERPTGDVFFGGRPALREIGVGVLSFPLVLAVVIAMMLAHSALPARVAQRAQQPARGTHRDRRQPVDVPGRGDRRRRRARGAAARVPAAPLSRRSRPARGWASSITSLSFGMGHTLQGFDAAIITGTLGAIWVRCT